MLSQKLAGGAENFAPLWFVDASLLSALAFKEIGYGDTPFNLNLIHGV